MEDGVKNCCQIRGWNTVSCFTVEWLGQLDALPCTGVSTPSSIPTWEFEVPYRVLWEICTFLLQSSHLLQHWLALQNSWAIHLCRRGQQEHLIWPMWCVRAPNTKNIFHSTVHAMFKISSSEWLPVDGPQMPCGWYSNVLEILLKTAWNQCAQKPTFEEAADDVFYINKALHILWHLLKGPDWSGLVIPFACHYDWRRNYPVRCQRLEHTTNKWVATNIKIHRGLINL